MVYQSNEHCVRVNAKYRFTFKYVALEYAVAELQNVGFNYIIHDVEF